MSVDVSSHDKTVLDEKEAAAFLGVSKYFMQKHRSERKPRVPYIRLAANRVRYFRSDLIAFAEKLRVNG
jgi:hypothetical protein